MGEEEVDFCLVDDLIPEGAVAEYAIRAVLFIEPETGYSRWASDEEGSVGMLTVLGFLDMLKEDVKAELLEFQAGEDD